jgi:hypothetical protein
MLINHEEASRTKQTEYGWWTYPYKVDDSVKGAISTNVMPVLGVDETKRFLEGVI